MLSLRWVVVTVLVSFGCASEEDSFLASSGGAGSLDGSAGIGGAAPVETAATGVGGATVTVTSSATGGGTRQSMGGATVTVTSSATGGGTRQSMGGATAAGGTTARGTTAAGGVVSYGGTSSSGGTSAATTTAYVECRFLSPTSKGVIDAGPCSVFTEGRYHCNEASECVSKGYMFLDCDHDGTPETSALTMENCGKCGRVCAPQVERCGEFSSTQDDWYSCGPR